MPLDKRDGLNGFARFAELQNKTQEILSQKPEHIAWLLRHSIRGPIPKDPKLRDVALNDDGQRLAMMLGERLAVPVGRWLSSPMKRCVQTMNGLRHGRNLLPPIQCTRALGDPGPFVEDPTSTWESYARLGKYALVETLTERPQELQGFSTVIQGIQTLFQTLRPPRQSTRAIHSSDKGAITLACSHDIIMAVLISFFLKRGLASKRWPDFTEGILIIYHRDDIEIHYQDFRFRYIASSLRSSFDK